jgi:hypothetical protein
VSAVGPPSGGEEERRLDWLIERHPDLAVNDEDGNECMFRRDELLVPAPDMARVTGALRRSTNGYEEASLGIVRLRTRGLGRPGDLIDVSRTLNDQLGIATAPNSRSFDMAV